MVFLVFSEVMQWEHGLQIDPVPFIKKRGLTFSKSMEMGGQNIFPRKGGVLEMGGVAYYSEVFLEIPHDVA